MKMESSKQNYMKILHWPQQIKYIKTTTQSFNNYYKRLVWPHMWHPTHRSKFVSVWNECAVLLYSRNILANIFGIIFFGLPPGSHRYKEQIFPAKHFQKGRWILCCFIFCTFRGWHNRLSAISHLTFVILLPHLAWNYL